MKLKFESDNGYGRVGGGTSILKRVLVMACIAAALGLYSAPALGQDGTVDGGRSLSVFDHFLVKGGLITWLILVPLSVTTVALTLEYCLTIRRGTLVPPDVYAAISESIGQKDYASAIEHASQDPSMLAGVVHMGLMESGNGFAAMQRSVEESLEERSARLLRKIEYLNVIGNISPMVGLFGTVYGMISLFASIREAGGMPEPARIADDISIALVTTFWGLLIAIPALSVFALFRNRIDVLTAECALAADRLLSPFKPGAPELGRKRVDLKDAAVKPLEGETTSAGPRQSVPQP